MSSLAMAGAPAESPLSLQEIVRFIDLSQTAAPCPTPDTQSLHQFQLLDVVTMRSRDSLECLRSFQTHDVDIAADIQQDSQHSINHGSTVRRQG
eukprot:1610545-Pyramimonas_sp.AAC.1